MTIKDKFDSLANRQLKSVHRSLLLVLVGMLTGLLWKFSYFRFADATYFAIPIRHEFFPGFLRNAVVLRVAYLMAGGAIAIAALGVWQRSRFVFPMCITALASISVLLCHQGSYNDVTFMTLWWCGVYASWLSSRINRDDAGHLISKASCLSRAIVSLVFLGGAVGKWTPEYWSGEVLFEIYFVDREFWFFSWIRSQFLGDSLRMFATHYSRVVIVIESLGAFAWVAGFWLPSRSIAVAAAGVFFMIGVMSNFWLFSVLAPMIGLAMVGWFDTTRKAASGAVSQ